MICPLTPQLLEKWLDSPAASLPRPKTRDFLNRVRLSMDAHVRLIAALDKNIPCWPEPNHKLRRIDGSLGQFDLALASVVREAGGHISLVEAYRQLSHPTKRNCRPLTIEGFLQMLRGVECIVVEFKDPELPIVRLRPSNRGALFRDNSDKNGKSSTAGKVHSNLPAIQFFGTKSAFCERHAVGRR
jgi:hypothetical protein